MSERAVVFDPFQNGWDAFEFGGLDELNRIEAPHFIYEAEPELAAELAKKYEEAGLQPTDLRFGVWADGAPRVAAREEGEPVGVHLNVFGRRPVPYHQATPPERHAMDVLTGDVEELLRDTLKPEHGVAVCRFGKIPTMHHHVVAREKWEDALDWKTRLPLADLGTRRAMRDRVRLSPERQKEVEAHIGDALLRFA